MWHIVCGWRFDARVPGPFDVPDVPDHDIEKVKVEKYAEKWHGPFGPFSFEESVKLDVEKTVIFITVSCVKKIKLDGWDWTGSLNDFSQTGYPHFLVHFIFTKIVSFLNCYVERTQLNTKIYGKWTNRVMGLLCIKTADILTRVIKLVHLFGCSASELDALIFVHLHCEPGLGFPFNVLWKNHFPVRYVTINSNRSE